jgi:DNA-binding transcriptional ArsR family regulator
MELSKRLKALADDNRLRIIEILMKSDLCVGALARTLGISKPSVSQHLKLLREAGLVRGEKRGYWTHYWVDKEVLSEIALQLHRLGGGTGPREAVCRRAVIEPLNEHEKENVVMCQNCCQNPEKLKDKPEGCTPDQIRECHGDAKEHPCREENRDE